MVPEWCEVGSLGLESDWHWIVIGLAIDCYMIDDGLAWIGISLAMDRHKLVWNWWCIGIRLTSDWQWIYIGLAMDWYCIGNGLALHRQWIGLARLLWAVNDGVLRHFGGSRIVLVPSALCDMSVRLVVDYAGFVMNCQVSQGLVLDCRMGLCNSDLSGNKTPITNWLPIRTQNRPPTRPAVGPNRSLVPRLKAALSSEDWHDLCQCVPMCCQLVTIQFFMIGADRCVQMGHLVIVIWSVWHWIGEMAMDWHNSPGLV